MTRDQYRQNVIDRFGCISRADLARIECAAMRARDGKVNMAAREAAQINGRRRLPTRDDRRAAIVAALPGTKDTIAATVGIGKAWVSEMLTELKHEGRVDFRKVGSRSTVWEMMQGAAE
jgi:hypothetical protein